MTVVNSLQLPFATWQQGLGFLADAASDPARERIALERLEATVANVPVSLKDILALAVMVPSQAHFELRVFPKRERDPGAVDVAHIMGKDENLNRSLNAFFEAHENVERLRQQFVFDAFPGGDARRILKDTIFGFSAALLSDVSLRLGESDPFLRIARRLSLWFKPFLDFSRYGLLPVAEPARVVDLVRRLAGSVPAHESDKCQRLIAIWAGEKSVEATEKGIIEILSLVSPFSQESTDGLDAVLALATYSALTSRIESLDLDSSQALFGAMKSIYSRLDDNRPSTAVFRTWLSKHDQRLRLTFDFSETLESVMYAGFNAEAAEPILMDWLNHFVLGGHSTFASGVLPLRGILFGREGPLFGTLSKHAPEAADLYALSSVDGDFDDANGPIGEHWFWTGDGVGSEAATFPQVIDRASQRGDYALCDMLIGCWTLYCHLFQQAPLPDLVGTARRINALPMGYRTSAYAVLGILRQEGAANDQIRRDIEALLSWLPVIETAPPEDCEAFMQDLFSPKLWSVLTEKERARLVKSEEIFVGLRRLTPPQRQPEQFRHIVVDWSAVAELFLRRAAASYSATATQGGQRNKPLGDLVHEFRQMLKADTTSWAFEDRPRMYAALNGLNVLMFLNDVNKKGGKHLGGEEIIWEDVVNVHAGLYSTLKALLAIAGCAPVGAKR